MYTEFVKRAHSTHESIVAPIPPRVVTDGVVAVVPVVVDVPCGCAGVQSGLRKGALHVAAEHCSV